MDRGRAHTPWTSDEDVRAEPTPDPLSSALSAPVLPGPSIPAPAPAVPTACLACRQKHLKCDGQQPCARCVAGGVSDECIFVASRRGYKGPRRVPVAGNPNKRRAQSASPPPPSRSSSFASSMSLSVMLPTSPDTLMVNPNAYPLFFGHTSLSGSMPATPFMTNSSCSAPTYMSVPTLANPIVPSLGMFHGASAGANLIPTANHVANTSAAEPSLVPPALLSHAERCFDSFYHHFYASHPFVLPRDYFLRLVKGAGQGSNSSSSSRNHRNSSNSSSSGSSSGSNSNDDGRGTNTVDAVLAAMRYLGYLYIQASVPNALGKSFLDEAMRICYRPHGSVHKDGFLVQALLLILIGLDGNCEQAQARSILDDCERIALEIGLNTRAFATTHGRGQAVMEESWRRTWWDLYVCDGMIAGVHRMTNFALFDVVADVGLPCEEVQYTTGQIPPPSYMEDFDDQIFLDDGWEFSSFAYRIAAARNLGRMMRTNPLVFSDGDESLARIDALLTNWKMHLPPSKRHNLGTNGGVDEMMFQGRFITHACTILLHQPLSQLDSSPAKAVTSCAPHRPIFSGSQYNTHTRHTLTAAQALSNMITQATHVDRHTPFFTCAVSLSSIVHLSRWAAYYPTPKQQGGSSMVHGLPTPCSPHERPQAAAILESAGLDQADRQGGAGGDKASSGSANNNMHDQGSLDSTDDDLRQMIRLNVGALQRISGVWRAAATVCGQVKGVAQEVYRAKKVLQQASPVFWTGMTEGEILSAISEDDGIMAEFDRLNG